MIVRMSYLIAKENVLIITVQPFALRVQETRQQWIYGFVHFKRVVLPIQTNHKFRFNDEKPF